MGIYINVTLQGDQMRHIRAIRVSFQDVGLFFHQIYLLLGDFRAYIFSDGTSGAF